MHVIFGTGALGLAVMRQLHARGDAVRMVSLERDLAMPEGVEHRTADALDPSTALSACEGATTIFGCAWPELPAWATDYPTIQANLLAGARESGALLVDAGDLWIYGEVDGPMREDSPVRPTTRKGQLRARMAQTLLDAHARGEARVVLARGPDLYGTHAGQASAYGGRVFWPAFRGEKVAAMGKIDVPHSLIYVEDFARGLITLADHPETSAGEVWHVPASEPLTQRRMLNMVFEEARQRPRISITPRLVFKGIGLMVPYMKELNELLYTWEKPWVMDDTKFREAFETQTTPHVAAIRDTMPWYRVNPDPKYKG